MTSLDDHLRAFSRGEFLQEQGGYRYLPLRAEDVQAVREWRNAQIEVLRQRHPITPEAQERWFRDQVLPTHARPRPEFLLVSILDQG
ncbi:MAG: hypothetical protein KC933_41110, partial [Myxococcales bacterium]|nr:hypothetical protein [Myxococcales bacterium]